MLPGLDERMHMQQSAIWHAECLITKDVNRAHLLTHQAWLLELSRTVILTLYSKILPGVPVLENHLKPLALKGLAGARLAGEHAVGA